MLRQDKPLGRSPVLRMTETLSDRGQIVMTIFRICDNLS